MATRKVKLFSRSLTLPAILAVLFFFATITLYPLDQKFQLSVDEGFNLQRSSLVAQGYDLYSEVASDQPPLFTYLLANVLNATHGSPTAARVLVILFSSITIFSMAGSLSIITKPAVSFLVLPLYFILPWYMHLSIAIMIGLPSIAFAALSTLCLILYLRDHKTSVLALSAIALAISMMIKMFTGFLVPVYGLLILFDTLKRDGVSITPIKKWRDLIFWSIAFLFILSALAIWLYGIDNISSGLMSHFGKGTQNAFTGPEFQLWTHLKKIWHFLLFSIFGFYFVIRHKLTLSVPLIAWVISATISLSLYSPVWAHHQLLITVPLVVIQAIGVYYSVCELKRTRKTPRRWLKPNGLVAVLGVVFFIGIFTTTAPNQFDKLRAPTLPTLEVDINNLEMPDADREILALMDKYAPSTNWVVTDMPYYASTIGKNVPPQLATFSTKMFNSGVITSYDVLKTIENVRPEQVLIGRIHIKQVDKYLSENYLSVMFTDDLSLYIRPDIYEQTK